MKIFDGGCYDSLKFSKPGQWKCFLEILQGINAIFKGNNGESLKLSGNSDDLWKNLWRYSRGIVTMFKGSFGYLLIFSGESSGYLKLFVVIHWSSLRNRQDLWRKMVAIPWNSPGIVMMFGGSCGDSQKFSKFDIWRSGGDSLKFPSKLCGFPGILHWIITICEGSLGDTLKISRESSRYLKELVAIP